MHVTMMKLSDIKIPERFQANPPKREKIDERIKAAKKKPLRVAVNADGWLTALYASYIAARELGQDEIGTIPGKDTCTAVAARRRSCGAGRTGTSIASLGPGWRSDPATV